ncbi:Heme chaperone--apocytochrome heme-lyase CcmF [Roseomonas mucosa]|uniref:Heme chaperone--apocytochrome heme-lyase CcmF n=2 Tax=Roseomonas TaxID=125216 RepID=A0A4Y1MTB4_9PROT|nr:heme lyase CcmF/NrfE family subunit [Roseomonas mucosa]AWV21262.1 Heme chaperone--apocytochrome heme-lyase CcmF [Roseomonas mucosa]MDT8278483.1 heme lyase CcmF/NrfE family subunit [Roseomonas mucosa]MDT8355820.1 heme lyase CcmF/NrfE family subunit [Roseomonas mucosa]MDU7522690.1 heme lyase CcmF/NrfE family subunit [Roseomonas mucosa]
MTAELGHFALALACAIALAQSVLPLWGAQRGEARLIAAAPGLALSGLLAVAAAFGALLWCFASNDTSVLAVVQNSHSAKPMLYKLSGAWGNHEGSMVLWVLILGLCSGAVALFGGSLPGALRARVLAVLGMVSAGFLLFILATSNPFTRVWPAPMDGQGLNPVLQDPGLAFHPPILYAGYVGFAVTFAFAVAALIEGRVDAAWGRWVRPWALAAWSFLTLGIALGSWWAYYTLGWGGFWFWDPVENASLLPWLAGTALLHTAVVVEKREALKIWAVLLAILGFGMSLLGTFLVRSGVLNSVHAFASDPQRGIFILVLLALYLGGALALFAFRAPAMAPAGRFAPLSREGALVLNNLLLCSITAVVLVGTLYPMFADLVLHAKISVGPPFFNTALLPLVVPLVAATAAGPVLAWKRARLWPVVERLWWAALCALGAFLVTLWIAGERIGPAIGFAGAAWLVLGACADLAGRVGLFSRPGGALARAARLPRAAWGAALAHAGLGVTLAGLAGMGLATDKLVALKPGGSTDFAGYEWRLDALRDVTGPNWTAREARLEVLRDGKAVTILTPQRRFFPLAQTTTGEAAIRTNAVTDLYAVMGEEGMGRVVLRLHHNTLAPWIWFGAVVMALGGGLSLSDRRARVAAPARKPVAAEKEAIA